MRSLFVLTVALMQFVCFVPGAQADLPVPSVDWSRPVPWAMTDTTIWDTSTSPPTPILQMGDHADLRIVDPIDWGGFVGPGSLLCVAFEGDSGREDYRWRVSGFDGMGNPVDPVTLTAGETIGLFSEPVNIIYLTYQGLRDRLARDTVFENDATAYADWLFSYNEETGTYADTTRIVAVPLVHDPGGGFYGTGEVTVVGFSAYFIESFDRECGIVQGRFVSVQPVPEPSSIIALFCCLGALPLLRRRRA